MAKTKKIRQRGKIRLSRYFKVFKEGDKVAIVKEQSVVSSFPKRMIGKTGVIIATRGSHKMVELNDGDKVKKFIVHPIHLKKLQ